MARYPIKMLKDEEGNPFVPLVSTEGIQSPDQRTLAELLGDKLETDNIIPGENVTITTDGNDITISTSGKGVLIDDLNTATAGLGGLDAHQGKVLKEMIPNIVDDVTSTSTTEALSANQGYVLNQKVVPAGGKAGQVLKKKSDASHSLEWGDAADPNAIVGDGSIKKIVEITYEDYKILEDKGQVDPNTEYHILDAAQTIQNLQDILDGLQNQITTLKNSLKPVATSGKYTDLDGEPSVVNNLTSTSTTDALSAAQGKALNDFVSIQNVSSCASLPTDGFTAISCDVHKIGKMLIVRAAFTPSAAITTSKVIATCTGYIPAYATWQICRSTASTDWFGAWTSVTSDGFTINIEPMKGSSIPAAACQANFVIPLV